MTREDTSYRAYWDSVESLADEVIEREKAGDDANDALHEAVDGTSWVIYTHESHAVMEHTRNSEYGTDNGLICDLDGKSFGEIVTIFAFWSLYGDVLDALDDARERWDAAHPEAAEASSD